MQYADNTLIYRLRYFLIIAVWNFLLERPRSRLLWQGGTLPTPLTIRSRMPRE